MQDPAPRPATVSIYAPPATTPAPTAPRTSDLRHRALALLLAGVVLPFAVIGLGMSIDESRHVLVLGLAIPTTFAVLGIATCAKLYARRAQTEPRPSRLTKLGDVALVLAHLGMAVLGAFATLLSTLQFTRGRQIRSHGRTLLPRIDAGPRWLTASVGAPRVPSDHRARIAIADRWRENGRTEHASVAAFARLTLDLVALGAPPALVVAAQEDALDEIRHAELCFSLAHAIDGREASPGAFPEAGRVTGFSRLRTVALAELAVSSFIDGAINEGLSARVVARLARRCDDPAIRAVLRKIAADEGRHAAHGWDVVRFCLAEGGVSVAHALAGAVRALPSSLGSTPEGRSREGAWEPWGIPGRALEDEEHAKTRADAVRRLASMLAAHDVSVLRLRPAAA